MRTLWDLMQAPSPEVVRKAPPVPRAKTQRTAPLPRPDLVQGAPGANGKVRLSAAERYQRMQKQMLSRHGVRVRKWRSGTSGVAWQVYYHDGTIARLIESPRPRGPMSAAVFLHEIGHHAIGFETYRPRCLEELHAWRFALDEMDEWGIVVTRGVRKRVHESLAYAVSKALRRGIKCVPPELEPFAQGRVAPGCWIDPRASVASGPS
ncbi:MAG: hypothetical protein DYG94_13790 [Leptolyngbya sp. PLA3]|nr:MAG: hypothetical protein EDM82_14345 [Cyanobacteria bacterium CYA]MCE7969799.1 hypothetical protein [Leptolyngbya sp. PL-A3]